MPDEVTLDLRVAGGDPGDVPAADVLAGDAPPRYQLLGHLADGGMAELYFARVVGVAGVERHVVLKRILPEFARNPAFVEMFLDEARLAAQLHHANIAQVFDVGQLLDSYFFTMEYVHGETARELLRRCAALGRPIPLEVALTIVAGAAAGLHYAHEKRSPDRRPLHIVHRDVSPSNLIVGYDGVVKLVDFGIAKAALRGTGPETTSGTVKGKVAYMSPEQCRGAALDRRSDIFALGIVLFELATGARLFKHESDYETMEQIVHGTPPQPSARRPELPRRLDRIVARALAKAPEDRYQTAAELLDDVERLARDAGLALSPTALGRFVRDVFGDKPEPWFELRAAAEPSESNARALPPGPARPTTGDAAGTRTGAAGELASADRKSVV